MQRKGTVRRLDLFSRVFLNEAERQEEGHRLLNTNTLTLCDYVLRPTSKWSSGWEKPKLKAENHQSLMLSFFRCFLKSEYAHDDQCILWILKAGDPGSALVKRNPRRNWQNLAFETESHISEIKQMILLRTVQRKWMLLQFSSPTKLHYVRKRKKKIRDIQSRILNKANKK